MERLTILILVLGCLYAASGNFVGAEDTAFNLSCKRNSGFPKEVCEDTVCTEAIKGHIKNEFDAAFKYMYMAAHFAQDFVDRPGLAKFLFEAASEERSHAIQMLDYLNLRGVKLNDVAYSFNTELFPDSLTYQTALEEAINMEIEVTNMIYNVVAKCDKDFHAADVFTDPILDEQHDGVRKLQGAYRTFLDLQEGHGITGAGFAEYIFDRKMLSGDI